MDIVLESFILPLLFLVGASAFTMKMKGMQVLGRTRAKREFTKNPILFFFYFFQSKLFPANPWDNYFFVMSSSKHILRMLYAITAYLYLISFPFAKELSDPSNNYFASIGWVLLTIAIIALTGLIVDAIARIISIASPPFAIKAASILTTFFLVLFSPVCFLFLEIQKLILPHRHKNITKLSPDRVRDKILEFVHDSELSKHLDPSDKRIISSIASFRERTAKEIMVPRIDIFALDITTPIHKAATALLPEGYSRIPVYRESIDDMVGVLLYKDVVKIYFEAYEKTTPDILKQTIESLVTPILFTPETKKISLLLQQFKKQQSHLAVVVDEYGGTEGLVTIEDVLEELVGEISDEYDFDEEQLHKPFPSGGWIVDARMNILDIQKELEVALPQSPEYDTIGGYIYHKAGTIPSKGWRLHTDRYNLEVLSSSERGVDKVWIQIPTHKS